jgi:hypothetical protein
MSSSVFARAQTVKLTVPIVELEDIPVPAYEIVLAMKLAIFVLYFIDVAITHLLN